MRTCNRFSGMKRQTLIGMYCCRTRAAAAVLATDTSFAHRPQIDRPMPARSSTPAPRVYEHANPGRHRRIHLNSECICSIRYLLRRKRSSDSVKRENWQRMRAVEPSCLQVNPSILLPTMRAGFTSQPQRPHHDELRVGAGKIALLLSRVPKRARDDAGGRAVDIALR